MNRIAFFGGSFSPFTYGHLAVVCEALAVCDKLIIGVGINPDKKEVFTADERIKMIKSSLNDFVKMVAQGKILDREYTVQEICAAELLTQKRDVVQVVSYEGLTIDAAYKYGANIIIRGKRNTADHDEEVRLEDVNRRLCKIRGYDMSFMLFKTPYVFQYVSSTTVRNLMAMGEYIVAQDYVTPSVHNKLSEKYLAQEYAKLVDCSVGFNELCDSFYENDYHNFSHIAYCLNMLKMAEIAQDEKLDATLLKALKLAIFWHDRCEDVKTSANDAECFLKEHVESNICEMVKSLIMATDHAKNSELDELEALICDLDLAILGDEENYRLYMWKIREECKRIYTTNELIDGRKKFLLSMIGKEIFRLTYFKKRFEDSAKRNMMKELVYWNNFFE